MLNAIFEEADVKSKASASVASGDWSGWTAGELDELVKDGEQADELIGKIIRTGRECPDGLWEALSRKYSREELSGSIAHQLIDGQRGRINLHQSFTDRLNDNDLRHVIRSLGQITAAGDRATREVRTTVDGRYHFQRVPWDTSEIEKAKTFIQAIQAAKRKKAALKGLETKKTNREQNKEGNVGLKPIQTEHWHRWMPDEVPTEDTLWEKLRPRLKTQSKLDMDIMVREMEKAGVITPNEHGNKVFRAAKYQEIMNAPREKFATSHVKDYSGQYSDTQMIRGRGSNPALVSVGLPLPVEKKWKTEHPKLYDDLKVLRDKKQGGHAAVMKGSRPIGWVRIDKLDEKNWLIEELQQDIDNISDEGYAKRFGHDVTGTWEQQHKRKGKEVETLEQQMEHMNKTVEASEKWLAMAKKWKPEWDKWEEAMPANHDPALVLFKDYGYTVHNSRNEEIPGHKEWEKAFDECFNLMERNAHAPARNGVILNWMSKPKEFEGMWLKQTLRPEKILLNNKLVEARTQQSEMKSKMDDKHPEEKGAQAWKKDIDAMREVVNKFPRWAMHAVKVAAKENNVEKLWWVTYSQKKALGGANPPRSFTSDKLAKQFGFHKVSIDELHLEDKGEMGGLWVVGTKIQRSEKARREFIEGAEDKNKDSMEIDQYLWMAPVSQVFTEQTKPLDIGVFG